MKKTIPLFITFIVCFYAGIAQPLKSNPSAHAFSDSLAKIILDFKRNFTQIQGATLPSQGDMDVFKSTVALPGAIKCVIYRYHSKYDTTASWQALIYEGEDYKEALKAYKNIFKEVKKSNLKWVDNNYIGFSGEMEEPDENLRFSISSLHLDIKDAPYKQFVAEIEMINSFEGWEVHLNLQNKKDDADEY